MSMPVFTDLPTVVSSDCEPARACCGGLRRGLLLGWAVLTVVSLGAAAYFAGQASVVSRTGSASAEFSVGDLPLVNATAAVSSDKYSIATGPVGDESEGLFVLDHNSGLLQCSVIYPRMRQVMAQFSINVADALGAGGKGGSYLMVTGFVDFPRSNSTPAATTVAYVLDTATGNYACYGMPFDRTAVSSGRPQQSPMVLIFQGTANPVINRDSLR